MKKHSSVHTVSAYIVLFSSLAIVGSLEGARAILLPEIRIDLGISYSRIGLLIFVSYMGFFLSAFFSGFLADRYGDKRILIIGIACTAIAGALFLPVATLLPLFAVYFMLRVGLGSIDIVGSAHGARIFNRYPAAQMNLLHLCFGVGAAVSPILGYALLEIGLSWQQVFFVFAIPAAVLCAQLVCTRLKPHHRLQDIKMTTQIWSLLTNKKIWIFGVMLGVAVIGEGAFLDWIKNFLIVVGGKTERFSSMIVSMFYLSLILSRLISGFFADKIGHMRLFIVYVIGAIISYIIALSLPGVSIPYMLYGWFIGPLFPLVVLLAGETITEQRGGAIGVIIAIGGFIGTLYSALLGVFHDIWGSYIGFSIIIVGLIGGLIIVTTHRRHLSMNAEQSMRDV